MQQSMQSNHSNGHSGHALNGGLNAGLGNGLSQGASQTAEFYPGLPFQLPRGATDQLPSLAEWNARYIEYVLNFTKGKKTAAARILGINRRTLYRRKKAEQAQNSMLASANVTELPRLHEIQ